MHELSVCESVCVKQVDAAICDSESCCVSAVPGTHKSSFVCVVVLLFSNFELLTC